MYETERRLQDEHGEPPEISIAVPRMSDLQTEFKEWKDVNLPIDVLLVTVKDCEFLSCYSYLRNRVYRSFCKGLGYVFFGDMGKDRASNVKTALLRCGEGSTDPGGSLIVVKNAVTTLNPKVVFCVGYCGALNRQKSRLGDVVVSAKLTTFAHRKIMNDGIQPRDFTTPVSRDVADLIKHASTGWKAPLENPEVREVKVHCDGEFLSGPELVDSEMRRDELVKLYPKAIAIEMEGEGIFTAAFDLRMEWVVIKGISDYADGTKSASQQWRPFASVMAASVVSNLLKEASVLRDWPHYKGINSIKHNPGHTNLFGLIAFLVLLLSVGFSPQIFTLLFGNSKIQHELKDTSNKEPLSNREQPVPSPPERMNSDDLLDALLKSISGESGQLQYKGRIIQCSSKGRVHSMRELWVFDGHAWDIESGTFVEVKHRKKSYEAIRDAVQKLITELKNKGLLTND